MRRGPPEVVEMIAGLLTRMLGVSWGHSATVLTAGHRRASVDAAVNWWVRALRGREGVDQDALEPFARTLREDLAAGLDASYRVYLEANHQPKAVLRSAALAAGLNLDAFPRATTMAVTDARVEVSGAGLEPYELVHSA